MIEGSKEHAKAALNHLLTEGHIHGWSVVEGTRTHASIKDGSLRQRDDLPYMQWKVRVENYNLNAGEEWFDFFSTAEVIEWVQKHFPGDAA